MVTLKIGFRRAAREEFDRAVAHYEARRPGLGEEFLAAVKHHLPLASLHPERYPIAELDIRKVVISRFLYVAYFRIRKGVFVVLAVFHTSRDPDVWRSRM